MSFLTGSASFLQFELKDTSGPEFGSMHLEALTERRLGAKDVESAGGRVFWWGAGDHAKDANFGARNIVDDNALLFDFVIETNKLPADRYREYYGVALKAAENAGVPARRRKREAKAEAIAQLEEEAKDGRFKKWNQIPIFWDGLRNRVYYGTASLAHIDRFAEMFEDTFGLHRGTLRLVTSGTIGAGVVKDVGDFPELFECSAFVPDVTPGSPAWCPTDEPTWYGNEFLVWLWCGRGGSVLDEVTFADNSRLVGMFNGGVWLDCPRGETGDDTINAACGPRTPEARAALRLGKLPREAGFTIVTNDNQYAFKFDAELFAFKGVKLPKFEGAAGDVPTARIGYVREIAETFEKLYRQFLKLRLSDRWGRDLEQIRDFIQDGVKC